MLRFLLSTGIQLVSLFALAFASAVPIAMAQTAAQTQDYPNRSIRFLVPYSAGTATDVIARLYAQKLGDLLGQSIVVDNLSLIHI